jgi:hypothetical protein
MSKDEAMFVRYEGGNESEVLALSSLTWDRADPLITKK